MVLKYMMVNTSLAEDEAASPAGRAVQQAASASKPSKKVKFLLLLVVNVVVWIVVYNIWAGEGRIPVWEFLTANRGMVTGIMYNQENPCAIVSGEVVHEGDTAGGYRVVEIRREEVEFEKDGETFTKRVQ
ncbi:MAG: hypothetical protein JSV99_01320 [Planctomycetota bacterium]|nr:MAG: hypothetical protein JSV99_01320 [Planctomycetota bacterium]